MAEKPDVLAGVQYIGRRMGRIWAAAGVAMLSMGCSRQDQDFAKKKAKQAEQEIRHDVRKASEELKQGAKRASEKLKDTTDRTRNSERPADSPRKDQ